MFLGRAVDSTLLCSLSAIASQSSAPTEDTMKKTLQFLDYTVTQEEAVMTYNASEMKLAVHSHAGYLSEPKARSRAGGNLFLSSDSSVPNNNGAVLNIAHIIKHVMSSATEAKLVVLYIVAREKQFTFKLVCRSWGINNRQHHCKLITQWRTVWSTKKFNQRERKPWTFNFIGSETESVKSSSEYTGDQGG